MPSTTWSAQPAVKEQRRRLADSEAQDAPGLRVCWRRVPTWLASRTLEVEPVFEMPGLVGGPQPDARRDHVDGPVAHYQPLVLRFWEHDKTATFGQRATMELTAGAQQWHNAKSRPWNVEVARSVWRSFALGAFVKIAGKHDRAKLHAQIADEPQQRNADGPPLGALVVDVDGGDREVGARRVGQPAELASDHHALEWPTRNTGVREGTWIGVHVKSRAKVSL